ncbi:MAG: GNAT family N-acetyltransferase [Flavisolibacter sp.]
MEIKQAKEKSEFLKCWDVVRELRPHLDREEYLTLMLYMLDEGYKLVYVEEDNVAVAFCGYRIMSLLFSGRGIYIDDLCTLESHRGKGCAKALLDQVCQEAKRQEMKTIQLDSGHHRFGAHRLYLNYGFRIIAHHFILDVK